MIASFVCNVWHKIFRHNDLKCQVFLRAIESSYDLYPTVAIEYVYFIFQTEKTCSNGLDPVKNVNDLTKTCTVASDCGELAICENQICCPTPVQGGQHMFPIL